ncbi:YncE family protein [Mucilaginibacter arboris]|uniref:Phosphoesterase n=1 Tax=Mucilaginibacter arboris TaxID=2682090 RepID=A0A7K1SST1_9SPHI|nr:YncE family protein [Mucilaginibacter arboris]MVN20372.1 phosphoesterase [Mucilaginibacter arboris]
MYLYRFCFIFSWLVTVCFLTSCNFFYHPKNQSGQEKLNHHSAYDDSTLTNRVLPVMMPYNRLIDPAGKVIVFGSLELENHSLDVQPIPNTALLAVEDRYGIAIIDHQSNEVIARWTYNSEDRYKGLMSTYSGIQVLNENGSTQLFWSAANDANHQSYVFQAVFNQEKIAVKEAFAFKPESPSPLALPNEVAINKENGKNYLYVVLNGNNQLVKIDLDTKKTVWTAPTGVAPYGLTIAGDKAYVSNWGGTIAVNNDGKETAGVPFGSAYTDPKTGATAAGTVSVFGLKDGNLIKEIPVGLHPNDLISSKDNRYVYVANGNSDAISVISTQSLKTVETISVQINPGKKGFIGDTPNALILSEDGTHLYVANGMDNAVAVVKLGAAASSKSTGKNSIKGFIPTEAYPGGLALQGKKLFVTNLEGEGARVNSKEIRKEDKAIDRDVPDIEGGSYNSHHQKATVSVIDLPNPAQLAAYTKKVKTLSLNFRTELARLAPRKNQPARPIPERIGEPSVFKHVLYIIKENRTYDQVLGDMAEGKGMKNLCIYGDSITLNQHQLARDFLLLDNYYASGKCSAEGHQWTDAAMVNDYVEKNVRAWFRSYPHVQTDAMVVNQKGFIWNNAADHGKTVRIYGEACIPQFDNKLSWTDIYENYKAGKPFSFTNKTTISRVKPMLAAGYPGFDNFKISDQVRAEAFIKELKEFENKPGDQLPELMVMALPTDHTGGSRPGLPTPRAMVADNDLALGRIIEALTKSRFWKNTVVFVTEDDSQAGWDHISAYRTTGFVISPYSRLQKTVSTNYNQTSIVRSIEQILGIPPMNLLDASALPMFNCFAGRPDASFTYQKLANRVPLNEMNPKLSMLKGKALFYARQSSKPEYDHVDGGNDDLLNRILWFNRKGNSAYPAKLAGKNMDDEDD